MYKLEIICKQKWDGTMLLKPTCGILRASSMRNFSNRKPFSDSSSWGDINRKLWIENLEHCLCCSNELVQIFTEYGKSQLSLNLKEKKNPK